MNLVPQIKNEFPPNWERMQKDFNLDWNNTIVTYGGVIYSPNPVEDDILAHELVHVRQQAGKNMEEWCNRFLTDPKFRYKQELEAYRVQFGYWKRYIKSKDEIKAALDRMARELSGPMYGNCIDYETAKREIRNGR